MPALTAGHHRGAVRGELGTDVAQMQLDGGLACRAGTGHWIRPQTIHVRPGTAQAAVCTGLWPAMQCTNDINAAAPPCSQKSSAPDIQQKQVQWPSAQSCRRPLQRPSTRAATMAN